MPSSLQHVYHFLRLFQVPFLFPSLRRVNGLCRLTTPSFALLRRTLHVSTATNELLLPARAGGSALCCAGTRDVAHRSPSQVVIVLVPGLLAFSPSALMPDAYLGKTRTMSLLRSYLGRRGQTREEGDGQGQLGPIRTVVGACGILQDTCTRWMKDGSCARHPLSEARIDEQSRLKREPQRGVPPRRMPLIERGRDHVPASSCLLLCACGESGSKQGAGHGVRADDSLEGGGGDRLASTDMVLCCGGESFSFGAVLGRPRGGLGGCKAEQSRADSKYSRGQQKTGHGVTDLDPSPPGCRLGGDPTSAGAAPGSDPTPPRRALVCCCVARGTSAPASPCPQPSSFLLPHPSRAGRTEASGRRAVRC